MDIDLIEKEFKVMSFELLNYASVVCPSQQFSQLRARFLRLINNCKRNIIEGLDKGSPTTEED